jgi:hypothetical protein
MQKRSCRAELQAKVSVSPTGSPGQLVVMLLLKRITRHCLQARGEGDAYGAVHSAQCAARALEVKRCPSVDVLLDPYLHEVPVRMSILQCASWCSPRTAPLPVRHARAADHYANAKLSTFLGTIRSNVWPIQLHAAIMFV